MNHKNLVILTKKSVNATAQKLRELKSEISNNGKPEIHKQLQSSIERLEDLCADLQNQKNRLDEAEKISMQEMSEIEKGILQSLKSFGETYEEAGSLINR